MWGLGSCHGNQRKSPFPSVCKTIISHFLEDVPHLGVCSNFFDINGFWMVCYNIEHAPFHLIFNIGKEEYLVEQLGGKTAITVILLAFFFCVKFLQCSCLASE